ncbi:dTDP-4-dehydrorhamnose 3,5-epimerase family protein [candidate division WOR-3 bacterium]|nr:dTDP-4-dehydrorhamnose 3,5-epimerase family protein [candidate division WOR-3 bacterium]
MIDGVRIKKLRVIPDERGRLMEVLRNDDEIFEKFGQVYITTAYHGVVKGWHYHKIQADNMCVIKGMMKIVLFDSRDNSPTKGEINEFFVGIYNPIIIHIPTFVYHGFKCISEAEAIVINIPTEKYNYDNPDEYRVDPHGNEIPYEWVLKEG